MDEDEFERIWAQHNPPDDDPEEEHPDSPVPPVPPPVGPDDDDTIEVFDRQPAIPLTKEDSHNADYFQFEFGKNVRYDHVEKMWYVWHKGKHNWQVDDHEEVREMASNAAIRRVKDAVNSGSSDKLKVAMALLSLNARLRALEDLRSRSGIAIGDNHWNQQLDLFCVANGVIDLRTGAIRPGEPTDNISRASTVRYEPMAECPKWETFLLEVFQTQEMVDYVQTIVGYCMTGFTTEQVWFLLYGTGGNGKGVFVTLLQFVMGIKQYFESAAGETFISMKWGQSGSHNVAQLKNARLVVASEVPERAAFDGARIKALTGSDPVTAAAKYENNSTFIPKLKLMMLVNHLPSTRDDSIGFWRRLRTIPFEVSFIEHPNLNLVDELRSELPGILNWCVQGAVTWFQSGLAPEPASAVTLRTEYQQEMDPLGQFINDCIVETKNAVDMVLAREVFRVYLAWSSEAGFAAMNETNFGRSATMKALGLGTKKMNTGHYYIGIKIYEPGGHGVAGIKGSSDE